MPRFVPVQTNFTQGELSPRLDGRDEFDSGAAAVENMIVMPHGGVTRRQGTYFVAEVKDSSKKVRLIPFEYSVTQTYILEFGDLYMRVYTQGGQVLSGGSPYEITTPFLEAELGDIQFAQKDDVMYLVHENHPPQKLVRYSSTNWVMSDAPTGEGPWLDENVDTSWTITPSATTGTGITLTASTDTWTPDHVGALWRLQHAGAWGYVKITGYTSTTSVTADVLGTLGGTSATSIWAEGAFSDEQGYPRSVAFYEQRLWYGGTKNRPQTIWASKSGSYEEFRPGTADDDGLMYKLAAVRSNAIQWLSPQRVLMVGTQGAEYVVGEPTKAVTPTNIKVSPQTTYGSEHIQPVQAGRVTLFVQRGGRKIRELSYVYVNDSYQAPDLSILAEHITAGGILVMDYAQQPYQTVLLLRADGVLLMMTYEREQKVVAWHRHITDGTIESVGVIHRNDSGDPEGEDEIWIAVQRDINGSTKRYVERFAPTWDEVIEDAFFVDCGIEGTSGTPTDTWGGLSHLAGETVQVLADGAAHPDVTVDMSGNITLQWEASKVIAGLKYTPKVQTRPWWMNVGDGSTQGRKKRWSRTKVRLYKTVGGIISGQEIQMRKASDPMDEPVQPQSGAYSVNLTGWDEEARIEVTHDQPLPLTVLSIFGIFGLGGE